VSKDTIAQWKNDGLDKTDPLEFGMAANMVNAGKPLDATQYIALKQLDAKAYNDNYIRQKNDQTSEEAQARVKASNAEAADHLANAAAANARAAKDKEDTNEWAAYSGAMKRLGEMQKQGKGFADLSPEDRILIGTTSVKTLVPSLQEEVKIDMANNDDAAAKDKMQQIDQIRGLALQAITGAPKTFTYQGQTFANIPENQVADFLRTHPGATEGSTPSAASAPPAPKANPMAIPTVPSLGPVSLPVFHP
jgi:hypothetical protein